MDRKVKPAPPARLHVILARESTLAVVIRRGPAREVCTVLWDRQTDQFTLGQWLRGRIYEDRCDLSPDGRYLIYFAYDGRSQREHGPAWTAVSRAPWLKAVALYSKGSCWGGGGVFTGARTYWLDEEHRCVRDTQEVRRDLAADHGRLWQERWAQAGWRFREELDAAGDRCRLRERDLSPGWILRVRTSTDGYELEHQRTAEVRRFPAWRWADLDGSRLVWTERGCLFAAGLDRRAGPSVPKLLHDFNLMKFEERKAPY